jgi:hypothetical protein
MERRPLEGKFSFCLAARLNIQQEPPPLDSSANKLFGSALGNALPSQIPCEWFSFQMGFKSMESTLVKIPMRRFSFYLAA